MTQGSPLNSAEVRTRIEKYLTLIFQQMICKTLAEKLLDQNCAQKILSALCGINWTKHVLILQKSRRKRGVAPPLFCLNFHWFSFLCVLLFLSFLEKCRNYICEATSWVEGWRNDWHLMHWLWRLIILFIGMTMTMVINKKCCHLQTRTAVVMIDDLSNLLQQVKREMQLEICVSQTYMRLREG